MGKLQPEQYNAAVQKWRICRENLLEIQSLFKENSVFALYHSQIIELQNYNRNNDFCVEIGVSENNELLMIPVPLDENGHPITLESYGFSVYALLQEDLNLNEKQTYTVVKKSVFSKSMRKIDHDADVFFPVVNKPVMEQDKAVESIESWQNNAKDWFYAEHKQSKGKDIFTKFYVPAGKILIAESGIMFFCIFGLKYSEIYQKQLPALIFISAPDQLSNQSIEIESNTFDYAKPCPPLCSVMDFGVN